MTEEANQPLVSVIMPCFKVGRFISDALESVGDQTYPNWEVIAVDDCGPDDGSHEIIQTFAQKFSKNRILNHRHEINKGVSAARNTAIRLAEGDYLAFLDPDDWWMQNHLKNSVDIFKNKKEIEGIASAAYRCNIKSENESKSIQFYNKWEQDLFPYIMAIRCGFAMSGMVIKKSLFLDDQFDENPSIQHAEDWDMWLRFIQKDVIFHLNPNPSCYYRKHGTSATDDYHKSRERLRFATKKNIGIISELQTIALGKMLRIINQMHDEIAEVRQNQKPAHKIIDFFIKAFKKCIK